MKGTSFIVLTCNLIATVFCLLFVASPAIGQKDKEQNPQPGYTTSILREPVFNESRVLAEAITIDNWLNSNYGKLSYEQKKGPREHLYYLIDSRVKDLYAREGRVLPKDHDPILELLFSWTERLGVYGGSIVYNALRSPTSKISKIMTPLMKMPPGISLTLKGDLLVIDSEMSGWTVSVPYYFMISRIHDFTASNGLRTHYVVLSTGTGKHKSQTGHSQATLVLIFSPVVDTARFVTFWKQQFGISDSDENVSLGVRNLVSQRHRDATSQIYTEITTWTERQGSFAVVYSGVNGTYQWNRDHFLDFLRALRTRQISSPTNFGVSTKPELLQ